MYKGEVRDPVASEKFPPHAVDIFKVMYSILNPDFEVCRDRNLKKNKDEICDVFKIIIKCFLTSSTNCCGWRGLEQGCSCHIFCLEEVKPEKSHLLSLDNPSKSLKLAYSCFER